MRELLEGDILWGMFPMDSGNGKAIHPALVVGSIGGRPVALLGTSENVPPRSGPDVLVLAPRGKASDDQDWRLTGLRDPTRFSTTAKLFPVSDETRYALIGTISEFKHDSGCREWLSHLNRLSDIASRRLMAMMKARQHPRK
ncbi:MAG: hypothetical protein EPN36_14535 [Rhodanobacteraceae bacterium]|nr:MAG: hypothetical protein EPN36_14535 [Rhodanobacteraceae bacterium]